MSMPPLLLAATLLFWGWQAGWLWLAAIAAVALEGARFIPARWRFSQADLDRIWNLTVLIFFGSAVVAFVNNDGTSAITGLMKNQTLAARSETLAKSARSVIVFFQWIPLTLLPIVLAQAYSAEPRMDWSTFSWWLRRQRLQQSVGSSSASTGSSASTASGLNVLWPYFAACLLAASAANERSYKFTVGLACLVVWALWGCRPKRRRAAVWCVCVALALALGFVAQTGLRQFQRVVQRLDAALIARLGGGGNFDDKEHRTMLGSLGSLKLSGRIVLRVEADGSPPALLREASYNLFRSPFWAVPKQDFVQLTLETNLTTTVLIRGRDLPKSVTVSSYFPGGEGLIPLPLGAGRLDDLIADVETNRMGVVHMRDGPGFARFHVAYGEGASIDTAPGPDDWDIPHAEQAAVTKVIAGLRLEGKSPEQKVQAIGRFLADHFTYSQWSGPPPRQPNQTPLARFLLQTRSGHCEYFATAATLLLRAAGIPARYAVGFSVQENNGKQWIVRERHTHAWCLAWINNAWHDVDDTPGNWVRIEDGRASWWENVSDAWSRVWYEFSKWRWGTGDWKRYLVWMLVPLLGLAGWRLLSRKQWSRLRARGGAPATPTVHPGTDSEFYLVERKLRTLGAERGSGETLASWLARLANDRLIDTVALRPLLELHYRARFDPAGLNPEEKLRLKRGVESWTAAQTFQSNH
ncbi:MAG TPA: transglutaminase domain-containing protein [Verrucomicrobiae bacterium]|nr:transglutaminase domain-containing protein [Verrucomicrobiae bacterium]